MATPLIIFADAEVNVRFQQSFLSQGIDNKASGVVADGAYRGFRLGTNVAALTVSVEADDVFGDHVAAGLSPTGELLSIHRTSGDFGVNLSAFASQTVVLALVTSYTLGVATKVTLSAFQLSPVDQWTGAGDTVIGLGTVVVPAAGVIPAANITPWNRREPWQRRGLGENAWLPCLHNPSFEFAKTGSATGGNLLTIAQGWEVSGDDGNAIPIVVTEAQTHSGTRALKIAPVGAHVENLPLQQIVGQPVTPGRFVKGTIWLRRAGALNAGSTANIVLQCYDKDGNLLTVTSRTVDLTALTLDTWVEFTDGMVIPANAVIVGAVQAAFQIDAPGAGDVLFIDDFQVWLESNEADQPKTRANSFARDVFASSLSLAIAVGSNLFSKDQARFSVTPGSGEVLVRLDAVDPGSYPGGNTKPPALLIAGRLASLGAGLLDTAVNVSTARLNMQYAPAFTYTTLEEVTSTGAGVASYRRYAGDNRVFWTVNAKWSETTLLWSKDDTTKASYRREETSDSVKWSTRASGAGTWNDAGWSLTYTLDARVGNVTQSGQISTGGDIFGGGVIEATSFLISDGSLIVSGASTLNTLEVAGAAQLDSTLSVSGTTALAITGITGQTTINKNGNFTVDDFANAALVIKNNNNTAGATAMVGVRVGSSLNDGWNLSFQRIADDDVHVYMKHVANSTATLVADLSAAGLTLSGDVRADNFFTTATQTGHAVAPIVPSFFDSGVGPTFAQSGNLPSTATAKGPTLSWLEAASFSNGAILFYNIPWLPAGCTVTTVTINGNYEDTSGGSHAQLSVTLFTESGGGVTTTVFSANLGSTGYKSLSFTIPSGGFIFTGTDLGLQIGLKNTSGASGIQGAFRFTRMAVTYTYTELQT